MMNFLSGAANFWNLALLVVALGTIVWFIYSFALRRLLRARRIERLRNKRLMREASERTHEP